MDLETKVERAGVYHYDEAVELTGHGRYNYLVLLACCVIHHAVALDMFGFSVVVASATCDLQLGIKETGILASAPFAGVFFAFPFGYYADTSGRRRAMLLSTAVGFAFAALTSLSLNWQMMLAFKIIGCSFSTASFALSMTFLGECVSNAHRSRYLIIMVSMDLACEIVAYGVAYFVLPLKFHWPIPWLVITFNKPWRLFTLILAVPLGIGALLLVCLFESPKFVANKGETKAALKLLQRIYIINGGKEEEFPVKQIKLPEAINNKTDTFWSSLKKQTVPLFRPPLLWRTVQLFYLLVICSTTNNVFAMWFPTMVNLFFNSISDVSREVGFCEGIIQNVTVNAHNEEIACDDFMSSNTIYSGIILGLIISTLNLAASTLAAWRRLVLIGCYVAAGVSCILVGLVLNNIANITFFILIQTSAIGTGSVASYFVDLYPTSYRGLVTSLGMMMTRLASFAGVNLLGAVFVDHCNLIFYSWAIFILSGVAVALFLPSDKRK